jgi:hypothetical protein
MNFPRILATIPAAVLGVGLMAAPAQAAVSSPSTVQTPPISTWKPITAPRPADQVQDRQVVTQTSDGAAVVIETDYQERSRSYRYDRATGEWVPRHHWTAWVTYATEIQRFPAPTS